MPSVLSPVSCTSANISSSTITICIRSYLTPIFDDSLLDQRILSHFILCLYMYVKHQVHSYLILFNSPILWLFMCFESFSNHVLHFNLFLINIVTIHVWFTSNPSFNYPLLLWFLYFIYVFRIKKYMDLILPYYLVSSSFLQPLSIFDTLTPSAFYTGHPPVPFGLLTFNLQKTILKVYICILYDIIGFGCIPSPLVLSLFSDSIT